MVDWITRRLNARFEERTTTLQTMRGATEMTTGNILMWGHDLEREGGLIQRRTMRPRLLTCPLGVKGAMISAGSAGEPTGLLVTSSNVINMERERAVFHDCKKDQMCFHSHQLGHVKLDFPTWVMERV